MPKKVDAVIEAVRYASDGKIDFVRLYERHGSVWSDHLLVSRQTLLEQLQKGLKIYTGQRKPYLGSTVEAHHPVRLVSGYIVSGEGCPDRDCLDVPLL
ncbi:MAG: hypothetical protein N2049_07670 [Anaerolineales bacterium]|nr:hypothetical protein [Anaerolineales bacterium]